MAKKRKKRKTLSGFIIDLYEDPDLEVRLKKNPDSVLKTSGLKAQHVKIVRGGNNKEIHRAMENEGIMMPQGWIKVSFSARSAAKANIASPAAQMNVTYSVTQSPAARKSK